MTAGNTYRSPNRPIKGKNLLFIFIILGLLVLPIGIGAFISYRTTDQELTRSVLSLRQSLAFLAASTLTERFDRLIDLGVTMGSRTQLRQLVEANKWTEAIKLLDSVPHDFPYVDRVFITDPQGTLMADTPSLPGVQGQNFAFRDWYKGVSATWQPYISEMYQRTAQPPLNVVAIAIPIKADAPQESIIGILVLQIRLETFFDWSRAVDVGPQGFLYFVDQHGHIVGHPKFPPQGDIIDISSLSFVQSVLGGSRGVEILTNQVEKEERLIAYEPVRSYGWGVIAQQPTKHAFDVRTKTLYDLATVYSGIILLSIIVVAGAVYVIQERGKVESISERERRFRSLVEHGGDVITILDPSGTILYTGPSITRVLGYEEEELVKTPLARLLPQNEQDHWKNTLHELLSHPDSTQDLQYQFQQKQGAWRWMEGTITNLTRDPSVKALVCNFRDITDRKHNEETLKTHTMELETHKRHVEQEKTKIETILASIGDGLFATDRDGTIILMNTVAEDLTGYHQNEAIGKYYRDVFHFSLEKDPLTPYPLFVEEVVATGKLKDMPLRTLLTKEGGKQTAVADKATPLKDRDGNIFGCVVAFRDASREREIERAKDEFVAVAAHQLRTPLSTMRWNMEMLVKQDIGELPPKAKDKISRLHEGIQRMIILVNDLLDVTRIDQGEEKESPRPTDICEMTKSILQELEPEIQKKSLTSHLMLPQEPLPLLTLDQRRLRTVIQNLLTNAIKYNFMNGTLSVVLARTGNRLELRVHDTGIGIPVMEQHKVFSRFFRAPNAVAHEPQGSGLGLFVVKSYVEAMGGTIRFESQDGAGSTFIVTLPLYGPHPSPSLS